VSAGRDPGFIDVGFLVLWPVDWAEQKGVDGGRRLLTGRSQDIAADIDALERAGVRHLCLTFQTASLPETLNRMQRFAEEVMPLAR
jgi:hypothetical protein